MLLQRALVWLTLTCVAATAAAADSKSSIKVESKGLLVVEVGLAQGTNSVEDVVAQLAAITSPAPLHFVDREGAVIFVRTSRNGYERLLADPDLNTVRVVRTQSKRHNQEAKRSKEYISYELRLAATEAVAAEDVSSTAYAAVIVNRRTGEGAPSKLTLGPGMLLVRAVDERGEELHRTVVADPRLVRFEAVTRGGQFAGRADYYRTTALLVAQFPKDLGIAELEIVSGSDREMRLVSKVSVR